MIAVSILLAELKIKNNPAEKSLVIRMND